MDHDCFERWGTVRFECRGRLYTPDRTLDWQQTHASLPLAMCLGGDRFRVYFSSRDAKNRSYIGFLEMELGGEPEVVEVTREPVLTPGPLGCFDDHGVYAASLVDRGHEVFLYYVGWNPGVPAPLFYSSIGLAVSEDRGRTFRRHSCAPIMSRSEFDPCLVTSPCVLFDEGRWKMWYVSGFKWDEDASGLHSYYHIKYADSQDGIHWRRTGHVSVDHRPGERNLARPCIAREDGIYRMWYSFEAGEGYRLGYAESTDGLRWDRRDREIELTRAESQDDTEAVAYPWVFRHRGVRYMLHNGSSFGRDGISWAIERAAVGLRE